MNIINSNIEKSEADFLAFQEDAKEQLFAATRIPKKLITNKIDSLKDRREEALKYYNYVLGK